MRQAWLYCTLQGRICCNTKENASRDYISSEDLDFFLEGESAKRAMRVLDTDGDGRISLAEMRDAVIAIYRERKNLAFTLKARAHLFLVVPARAWFWFYRCWLKSATLEGSMLSLCEYIQSMMTSADTINMRVPCL